MLESVPQRTSGPTVTDLFCGAGGSSIGIHAAGAHTVMAANHWQLAVDTHQENFPEADHDCADISQVDPRRYPPTDLLWASPECTNHSQAKGVKRSSGQGELWDNTVPDEAADRSRATMWDVVRFLEAKKMGGVGKAKGKHAYKAAVVENVVDAVKWVLFPAWRAAIESLGYDVHPVYLNSMFAWSAKATPAPQSRDRVYFVIVPKGTKVDLDIRPSAFCPSCDHDVDAVQTWKRPDYKWGRYRAQYFYTCPVYGHGSVEPYALPAASAIDWSLIGERIGDRAKPLAPNTIRRIEAGLRKYANAGPSLVPAGGTWNDTGQLVSEPMRTRTTRETDGLMVPPMTMILSHLNDPSWRGTHVGAPHPTQTARQDMALVVPPSFLAPLRSGRPRTSGIDEPLATVVADGGNHMLVNMPFIATLRGGGSKTATPRTVADPFGTFSADGKHHMVVVPPGFIQRHNNSASGDQGWACTGLDEPVRTMTTKGQQSIVLLPPKYVMAYYRTGQLGPITEPLPTMTTVDRLAAIDPADLVDDCLFRMLTPAEIGAAMAFPSDYLVGGNKRERVRMYGNAVTPPAAALLVERVMAAIDGTVEVAA